MIVQHCLTTPPKLGWLAHGLHYPTLSDLVSNGIAASLDLRITEVRTEDDIDAVLGEVAPVQMAVIGDLKTASVETSQGH